MSDDLSGFSLMELFRTEAESQVATMSSGLLALEATGSGPAVIEPLMRAAHSLKGAARIVGLEPVEKVAHALEDVFVAAQHGRIRLNAADVDVLLGCVDLINEMSRLDDEAAASWEKTHGDRIAEAVQKVEAIESGTPTAAPAPVEAEFDPESKPGPEPMAKPEPSDARSRRGSRKKPAKDRKAAEIASTDPELEPVGSVPGPKPEAAVAAKAATTSPVTTAAPVASKAAATATVERPIVERESGRPEKAAPPIAADATDRVVRVTAENLNRLMGLAGASLVEARQLRPIVDALTAVKNSHNELWNRLQVLEDALASRGDLNTSRERELLSKAKHQAHRSLELLSERITRLENHARRNEDLSERLHHEVISSRLRPFVDGIRGFPRMVRDLGRQLGKKVNYEVVGEQTGVDRDILEKLESPLTHLIRNSLDHAIEPPEVRTAQGKDATGLIKLEARHVAGMLQITLTDDGRGIDPESVRRKIVERGLVGQAMAEQLTDPELLEFLFLSGFTTKGEVTEVSGRGVGLDVVQSMIQAVGGTVRVSTRIGQGTCFTLLLPITMSVIRALLVRIGGEPYAFPLSRLDRIQSVPVESVEMIEGRPFFRMDDQSVGLVTAAQVLDRPATQPQGGMMPTVVVSDRGHCFGVVVEEFLGERDLDVRPLDTRLGKVPNINAASVLEDGWPVLIIDVEDLVRSIDNLLAGRRLRSLDAGPSPAAAAAAAAAAASGGAASKSTEMRSPGVDRRTAKHILVVDDSITVRELERQLLESRGFEVDIAVDGMDGWNAVRSGEYDLVVTDVDMPRMDGIQLVTLIKMDPRFSALPVVIVSYKDRPEDRLRGLEAGADCYLTKSSFHDETFLNTVVDLIGEALE